MRRLAVVLLPAAMLAAAGPAAADELVLRNGRTLEGKVSETGDTVVFERPGIRMEIRRDEVREIRKSPSPREEYAKRAAEIAKAGRDDAEARHRLGLWCESKGLREEARAEQEKALAADPEHAGARRALGHIRVDGKWRPEAEVMKERGLVPCRGQWVTPEEAARIEAGGEASPKEKARLETRERERRLKRSLNAALRKVAAADAATRLEGEKALTAAAREMGDPGLEARAPEIRGYYDQVYREIESARAVVQVRAQLVTLKRPIPTLSTSLGAFSSPVTLQLPELSVVSINTTAVVPLQIDED